MPIAEIAPSFRVRKIRTTPTCSSPVSSGRRFAESPATDRNPAAGRDPGRRIRRRKFRRQGRPGSPGFFPTRDCRVFSERIRCGGHGFPSEIRRVSPGKPNGAAFAGRTEVHLPAFPSFHPLNPGASGGTAGREPRLRRLENFRPKAAVPFANRPPPRGSRESKSAPSPKPRCRELLFRRNFYQRRFAFEMPFNDPKAVNRCPRRL